MDGSVFPEVLLSKLRCLKCDDGALQREGEALRCSSCRAAYPLLSGRFPDFLTDEQRAALRSEIEFWAGHFGETVYESESEESYRNWARLIRAEPDHEVIELGCGSGALLRRLGAGLLVGLEPVVELLTATRGFHGVVGLAENLPFRDACFDVVYFNSSLHHVSDKERGFSEAVRIARPGGRIVAIEPNGDHPQRRLISNPESPFRRCGLLVGLSDPVETFFSAADLRRMAERQGVRFERLVYTESLQTAPSFRKRLQKIYAGACRSWLPARYVYPNFFISFRKD